MMVRKFIFYVSLYLSFFSVAIPLTYADCFSQNASYAVCFTPKDNCTLQIVEAINEAQHNLYLQAYFLTSEPIVSALLKAKERGVEVAAILDKNHREHLKPIQRMKEVGIDIWIDQAPGIAHNKVIVIDEKEVITGSFNFTNSANYRNRENILFIRDRVVAKHYINNWHRCRARAVQEKPLRRKAAKKRVSISEMTEQERKVYSMLLLGSIIGILWKRA